MKIINEIQTSIKINIMHCDKYFFGKGVHISTGAKNYEVYNPKSLGKINLYKKQFTMSTSNSVMLGCMQLCSSTFLLLLGEFKCYVRLTKTSDN